MILKDCNKQLEQQYTNLAKVTYDQSSESEKFDYGCLSPVNANNLGLNGEVVPEKRVTEIVKGMKRRKDMKGVENATQATTFEGQCPC